MVDGTRYRGEVVRQAVLQAALDEVAEVGYAALTMETVAARAGVHKTTVYRRWPDREALLADAALSVTVEQFTIPDTGDIDRDLRTAARHRAAWFTTPAGAAMVAMLGSDAGRLEAMQAAVAGILSARTAGIAARLAAAAAVGQLPQDVDAALLLRTLLAPLYLALLVTREDLTADAADRAADITLAAARAGLLGHHA